jgi:hypothetical protein
VASLRSHVEAQEAMLVARRAKVAVDAESLRRIVRGHLLASQERESQVQAQELRLATAQDEEQVRADEEQHRVEENERQHRDVTDAIATVATARRLSADLDAKRHELTDARASLANLRALDDQQAWEIEYRASLDQLGAQAGQLRELAKHRVSVAMADPASTSGVFLGTQ